MSAVNPNENAIQALQAFRSVVNSLNQQYIETQQCDSSGFVLTIENALPYLAKVNFNDLSEPEKSFWRGLARSVGSLNIDPSPFDLKENSLTINFRDISNLNRVTKHLKRLLKNNKNLLEWVDFFGQLDENIKFSTEKTFADGALHVECKKTENNAAQLKSLFDSVSAVGIVALNNQAVNGPDSLVMYSLVSKPVLSCTKRQSMFKAIYDAASLNNLNTANSQRVTTPPNYSSMEAFKQDSVQSVNNIVKNLVENQKLYNILKDPDKKNFLLAFFQNRFGVNQKEKQRLRTEVNETIVEYNEKKQSLSNKDKNDFKEKLKNLLERDCNLNRSTYATIRQGTVSTKILEILDDLEPGFSASVKNPWNQKDKLTRTKRNRSNSSPS